MTKRNLYSAKFKARVYLEAVRKEPTLAELAKRHSEAKIQMGMSGCWINNRMIGQLLRSPKYGCVYTRAYETGKETKAWIGK